jgi:hypothetical protein
LSVDWRHESFDGVMELADQTPELLQLVQGERRFPVGDLAGDVLKDLAAHLVAAKRTRSSGEVGFRKVGEEGLNRMCVGAHRLAHGRPDSDDSSGDVPTDQDLFCRFIHPLSLAYAVRPSEIATDIRIPD